MLELPAPLRSQIDDDGRGLTILVIRLGAMGDVVRTLPAVRLIRFALPDARIHWVLWEPWADLLGGHPDLDGVIGLPRAALRRDARTPAGWPSLAGATQDLARRIRGLHPGLVLDFHGDLRSGLLGRLSGAPVRLGYEGHQQKEGNRLFTTHRAPAGDRRTPRLERNLDLVRALGCVVRPVPNAGFEFVDDDAEGARDAVADLVPDGEPYAILSAGASRRQAYKKPPPELFGAAARALAARRVVPLVVHGPGEEEDAARAVAASRGIASVVPAEGLKPLAGILARARLFVGGDSGPLHLACGVGCPVVGLYGPTDPLVNTPWGVPFEIVAPPGRVYTGIKSKDRKAGAFEGIDEPMVERAVQSVLSRHRSGHEPPL